MSLDGYRLTANGNGKRMKPVSHVRQYSRRIGFAIAATLTTLTTALGAESAPPSPRPAVVVACPRAWQSALSEWIAYRSKRYEVHVIDSHPNPNVLRSQIQNVANQRASLEAVLLCGDVFLERQLRGKELPPIRESLLPTFVVDATVRLSEMQTETLSTDSPFGDLDGDGCPDVAVGRLPAKSAEELKRMLHRSIEYERSTDVDPWRDRVHVTAGVGGFGYIADKAIETVARRYLAEGIPDRFDLQMTYASLHSPYCPDPRRLRETFLGKLNRGGLFWVYIGHGWIDSLDAFQYGDHEELICSAEDAAKFDVPVGPPIAVLLACFTGAIDAKVDCFAERLLAQPSGPIAVVAGTRVTMPYGLSELAGEMMESCFVRKQDSLGKIMLEAKQSIWQPDEVMNDAARDDSKFAGSATNPNPSRTQFKSSIHAMANMLSPEGHDLTEERREHVRLMNLLGDPLLTIRQPNEVHLQCTDNIVAGDELIVAGQAPWDGPVHIELLLHRDRLPPTVVTKPAGNDIDKLYESMQQNYERANQLAIQSVESIASQGAFQVTIPVDSSYRGKYVVRARMQRENEWATGTHRLMVQSKKKVR